MMMNTFCSPQPTKVLGIYTFTKRVNLEELESKPRKQQGYSTVSHFNIVHYDCHLAAVRCVKSQCLCEYNEGNVLQSYWSRFFSLF